MSDSKLSAQQRLFVEHYLTCWNATRAAKLAGYSEKTAYQQGHALLKKPEIQAAIKERISQVAMSADEVLLRLAGHARADIDDFIDIADRENETPAEKAEREANERLARAYPKAKIVTTMPDWELNLGKAKRAGKTHLIKSIKQGEFGPELSLHDPQSALVQLGRHHGLFTDKVEQTGAALDMLRSMLSVPLDDDAEEGDDSGE